MRVAPRTKLIALFALTGIGIFALKSVLAFDAAIIYWAFLSFAGVTAVDIYISRVLGLSVDFPDLVRLYKSREGTFPVTISGTQPTRLKIGLLFPENRFASTYEQEILLKQETESFDWPITGLKQGQYILEACHIETISRFGFWAVRHKVPL